MGEVVAEVAAKTILESLRKMRTRNPRIDRRKSATIVEVKGILQMSTESPRKKDQRRILKRKLT